MATDGWDDSQMSQPSILKYNVHEPFHPFSTEKNKEIATKLAIPVGLCLLNLEGDSNIGMSIRSAAVLGIREVFVLGKRHYDRRSTVGAQNYIKIHRYPIPEDPRSFFEHKGMQPILVEQGGTPLEEMNFKPFFDKPVVFIVGSESKGIDESWLALLHDAPRITISQYGLVRSLNVSMASTIIMYEYLKQWRAQRRAVCDV